MQILCNLFVGKSLISAFLSFQCYNSFYNSVIPIYENGTGKQVIYEC